MLRAHIKARMRAFACKRRVVVEITQATFFAVNLHTLPYGTYSYL